VAYPPPSMNASAYTSGAIHPKTFISFEGFFRTGIKINVNFFRMNNIDADPDIEEKNLSTTSERIFGHFQNDFLLFSLIKPNAISN
jgi:hypothetical protein